MAYISFKPTDYFGTLLWTGNGGASQAQTGLGFQPDFTWVKCRNQAENHGLYDSARGVTKNIPTNINAAESTISGVTAFGADGFTVGASGITGYNTQTYVGWNWKGGTTSVPSGGSITPTAVTRDTTSGFYCAKYSGNGTDDATLAHGLGVKPNFMAVRKLNATYNFANMSTAWNDNGKILSWTINNALMTDDVFGNTAASSDYIYLNDNGYGNASGSTYVIYAWAEKKGYSKFSSYQGNGNAADGPFVYTGFRPAFLMIKCSSATENWYMFDNKRAGYNFANYSLKANDTDAEATSTYLELLSNGFRIRNAAGDLNASTATFTYMAFAEHPLVGSGGTPGLAR